MTEANLRMPTREFLTGIDIRELLPQREPFVMIGKLTRFDERSTVTETAISPDSLFVEKGSFGACGLIENIAQTCAARIGYVNKYILKKGIQVGLIGAIRDMQVIKLPKVGDTITTRVDVEEEVFGMTLAKATVSCGDAILARAEMKIAIKEGDEA